MLILKTQKKKIFAMKNREFLRKRVGKFPEIVYNNKY